MQYQLSPYLTFEFPFHVNIIFNLKFFRLYSIIMCLNEFVPIMDVKRSGRRWIKN